MRGSHRRAGRGGRPPLARRRRGTEAGRDLGRHWAWWGGGARWWGAGARWAAEGGAAGPRRGSGRAARWWRRGATHVHARRWGARGCRARGGQARSGGGAGGAGQPGCARGAAGLGAAGARGRGRAAAGARRRGARRRWWTRGGRPRAGAWGGRWSSVFFTISDREFGLRPDLGFGPLPRAQIHGPRQRFFF